MVETNSNTKKRKVRAMYLNSWRLVYDLIVVQGKHVFMLNAWVFLFAIGDVSLFVGLRFWLFFYSNVLS